MKSSKPTKTQPAYESVSASFARLEHERKTRQELPYMSNYHGTLYVALTTVLLAYGSLFGSISILLFYGMWLPKINYKGSFLLHPTKDVIFVMLMPLLAIFSIAWSDATAITAHSAFEYASLVICTIIIAKTVRTRAFIRGLVIGSSVALIASIISGVHGLDPMTGSYTLIGLFGSKNMIGLFGEIGIILSLISLYIRQTMIEKFLFCIVPIGVCAASLYMSKSASSVLTLAFTLAILIGAVFIAKLPRSLRTVSLITFTFFALLITAVGTAYNAQDMVLQSVGKDSTLTGRTLLWDEGIKSGFETPVLGHGYSAYWIVGRPTAEKMWQKFRIAPGSVGFHFHNLFIETFAELGALGILTLGFVMLTTCLKSIRLIIRHGMSVDYAYALSISFMYLTRAMVEVDLIGTFIIGGILYFSIIPRLANLHREKHMLNIKNMHKSK